MNKTKATVDFTSYTGPGLLPVAQTIHDAMTAKVVIFPAPTVSMVALQGLITTYGLKLAAKASRATADTIAFNIARHNLELALADLGAYVNSVAKGDATIVAASGFPSFNTAHVAPDTTPPAAPANVVLAHGDLSGSVDVRYHPDRPHSMNEVQTCVGDPGAEANWKYAGMYSSGKATVSGIVPGTTEWFRVRTAGLKGVMGEWSDPAKIVVV